MANCRGCGQPMTLPGHEYHPCCDPQHQVLATCRTCGGQVKALTDSGQCGWCASRQHR